MGGGGRGIFEPQEFFFVIKFLVWIFFRPKHEYFLGLIGMQEFFSFNLPLLEYFFCTSPAPPISFLMVRPLLGRLNLTTLAFVNGKNYGFTTNGWQGKHIVYLIDFAWFLPEANFVRGTFEDFPVSDKN